MNEMIGHEREISWLKAAMKQNRLAHAYLFTDANQVKTKQLAIQLAKTINCEKGGTDSCDTCTTCVQIEHGNHPDVLTIQPEGAYIKIDQVRNIQETFRYRAPNHITRVLIIESAERMRVETANSLLKFLEEPISPMVAILMTDKKERILPTIQSRCQWVRFSSSKNEQSYEKYRELGFSPNGAKLLSELKYREELEEHSPQELDELVRNISRWSDLFVLKDEAALLDVQVGWLGDACTQGKVKSILELLLICLKENIRKGSTHFFPQQQSVHNTKESDLLLALENVLIASRLVQKAEIADQAVLEQMVIATEEGRKSKQDDWHLIVM
jgi:DNA polymerase-3 subunit delta'